ncbi:hypothetical protein [Promicromonospora sp. NPDC090134]|uniref:PH-like domain-containing protein n=1 Tax=Promicromonospora sp. NPDC090134 TaxID=3364408 RepID=UPI00382CF9B9
MTTLAVVLLAALAVFLVLYVTLIGRRRLAQRTTTVVPVPPSPPTGTRAGDARAGDTRAGGTTAGETLGEVRSGPVEAIYVSTTLHGDWLARVGAHGLGDRSHAVVTVHQTGVLIERDGTDDLWLPVSTIRSAGLAPGMAGKYVGADGLVVLTWAVPEADGVPAALVDTGLRPRRAEDRGGLVDAVRHLLASQQSPYNQHSQQHPEQQYPHQQYPHQQEAR